MDLHGLEQWYFGPKRTLDDVGEDGKRSRESPTLHGLEDVLMSGATLEYKRTHLKNPLKKAGDRNAFETSIKDRMDIMDMYMSVVEGDISDFKRWVGLYPKGSIHALHIQNAFRTKHGISLEQATTHLAKILPFEGKTPNLALDGVGIIQVIPPNELNTYIANFVQTEREFPEFNRTQPGGYDPVYVLGGFAAYGNPASFHNTFVKDLRRLAYEKLRDSRALLTYVDHVRPGKSSQYKVEVLFDRMLHRRPTQSPSTETAHRDVTPKTYLNEHEDDMLFGGWVNISKTNQYFICKPGSHAEARNTFDVASQFSGFSNISTSSRSFMEYIQHRRMMTIPPGCMIVFPQHILHEVMPTSGTEQIRLFIGWRVTLGTTCLHMQEKTNAIDTLGIALMPSGQEPPMYAKLHETTLAKKSIGWTGDVKLNKKIVDAYGNTTTITDSSYNPSGTPEQWYRSNLHQTVVNATPKPERMLKSLTAYGFDTSKYAYSKADRDFMLTLHPLV